MSASSSSNSAAAVSAPSTVSPIPVGIAGCTGVVGQRFVSLLLGSSQDEDGKGSAAHPYFRIAALSASSRSAGHPYDKACAWRISASMPESARSMPVLATTVEAFQSAGVRLVFSALDADIAHDFELALARAGIAVFSNARSYRMHPRVPILVPHANAEHIDIIPAQQEAEGFPSSGFIVTNANCSSTGLVVALRPLSEAFGIKSLFVTTLQAISGAGYPGVSALDITDNVIPFIPGEEDKMETEPQKILGNIGTRQKQTTTDAATSSEAAAATAAAADAQNPSSSSSSSSSLPVFLPASFSISAQCNRVATLDGHMENISLSFLRPPSSLKEVEDCLSNWQSEAQRLALPSAPKNPIVLMAGGADVPRPQPRLDRDREGGFVVTVGRVRKCPILDVKFVLCSHNTVLGAAGGSILNAELAVAKGYLK